MHCFGRSWTPIQPVGVELDATFWPTPARKSIEHLLIHFEVQTQETAQGPVFCFSSCSEIYVGPSVAVYWLTALFGLVRLPISARFSGSATN
jgi:hypothetical protein